MNKRLKIAISALLSIILVFVLTGLFIVSFADKRIRTSDFMMGQLSATNTYENAYNSLMKKFSERSGETAIPVSVYERSFSRDWMKTHIDRQISGNFFDSGEKAGFDYSQAEKSITEYFEEYARENHVIKDETYEKRLNEAISDAEKTAFSAADVYHIETLKKSGIWDDIGKARNILPKLKLGLLISAAVLIVLLIILGGGIYWTGTSLFAAGCIITVPAAYIFISDVIMKFSLKDMTAYTLATETMKAMNGDVLMRSIGITLLGVFMTAVGIIIRRRSGKGESGQ